MSNTPSPFKENQKVEDLEIKDPNIIFNAVWNELTTEYGEYNIQFPKEIFWLNGAPGAGKGTNTEFILRYKDLSGPPIIVSDILKSDEAKRRMDAGILASDKEVFTLVLKKLMEPQYLNGAIVDGFPRTQVQVECLKLLYNKLLQVRSMLLKTSEKPVISRPNFHIVVLFIDQAESVRRQLYRGQLAINHNKSVGESGIGELYPVRKTDLDTDMAISRYRTFKEVTYDALQSLREIFHYHYINAYGSIEEVQARIVRELKYQSSLELSQGTFDNVNRIPLANQISKHARQQLVYRLDDYQATHKELFEQVIRVIEKEFMPIIHKHAISGKAYINTENKLFSDPLAIAMLIDIFSERGYHIMVDVRKEEIPESVNRETFQINTRQKIVYRVRFRFQGCDIRRGH